MEIDFSLTKSVDENAATYFELAKKAKKKLKGAKEAIQQTQKKLKDLESKEEKFWQEEEKKQAKRNRKRAWYEKFHWFTSSEGFLCFGGRDATSNEIVVKKHTEPTDLVFHTDMAGSPFFVIRDGQKAGEATIQEAAQATIVHSRAWKLGQTTAEVFYVKPEQVTKEAQSGESLKRGMFMVYGKTTYVQVTMQWAIGLVEDRIVGGPLEAVKAQTKNFVEIVQGRDKKSATAKKVKAKLKGGDLDDIIAFLPAGGCELKRERKKK